MEKNELIIDRALYKKNQINGQRNNESLCTECVSARL